MNEIILSGFTIEQFKSIVSEAVEQVMTKTQSTQESTIGSIIPTEKKYLYSIKELAKFLNCCPVTAQHLKDKGLIPCHQIGRKLRFDPDLVLDAMLINRKNRGK